MKKFLHYVDGFLSAIACRLNAAATVSVDAAAVFRVMFGLFLLLFVTAPFSWIGAVPPTFFDPPYLSLANLGRGFPPAFVFRVYDFAAPLLILLITVGVKTRWCGWILVGFSLVVSNYAYSFGKVDHDILLWVTLLCFSFSNWGTRLALLPDKENSHHQTPITILAVCIAFGLLTAGFEKALNWVDFDTHTSGFLNWFYGGYFNLDRTALLAPRVFGIPPVAMEAGDYTAVLFETTGFVFLLLGRVWWRSWLTAACVFHMLNILFLNITFTSHVVVYLPFFLPFIVDRIPSLALAGRRTWRLDAPFLLAAGLATYHLVHRFTPWSPGSLFMKDEGLKMDVSLTTALVLYAILSVLGMASIGASIRTPKKDRSVPLVSLRQLNEEP